MKLSLPKEIQGEMDLWRMGLGGIPESYIQFNKKIALADLPDFAKANNLRVWGTKMTFDGWLDGMKFLSAVVEDGDGELFKIKFTDEQTWFKLTPGSGSSLMTDNRVKEAA
jgi:hypothetical protein